MLHQRYRCFTYLPQMSVIILQKHTWAMHNLGKMNRRIMVAAWIGHFCDVLESNKGEFGWQHEITVGLVRGDLWTFVAYVLRAREVWGKATSIQEIMAPALRKEDKVLDQREACSQQGKVNQRVFTPDVCNLLRERTEMPSGQAMGIGRTENLRQEIQSHLCRVSRKEPTGCDWKAIRPPQGPVAIIHWYEFIDL